jgi:PhnB protein
MRRERSHEMTESRAESVAENGTRPAALPLAPHLCVKGADAAIAFYERAFDAKLAYRQAAPDGRVLHAELRFPNGGGFMLCDDFPEMGGSRAPERFGGSPVTLHLDLGDVDAVWKRALDAGAKVEMPLGEQFWGARYGVLSDPFGHRWSLATELREVPKAERDAAVAAFGQ